MARIGWLETFWLARCSQPAGERAVHRAVCRRRPRQILELGLGTLRRTERMLRLARRSGGAAVHYVGLDRFEGRLPLDPPGATLKEAHRRLHALARVQLVPGNVDTALARLCNHLGVFDLVLVAAEVDPRHLERSWFFIQRLVNADTTVLVETADGRRSGTVWKSIDKRRVDELAAQAIHLRAA
ncbi:MAG: hypothetical protein EBZ74_01435 [Planctomycetia bacterium]|nr:hypothetical protein [Planctomycetia bacterium]